MDRQSTLINMIKILNTHSPKYFLFPIKYCLASLKTHYQLLQIDSSANFKQVKDRYILKSKMYHPDISPNSSDIYHQIQSAYKVLSAPQSRKRYDLSLGIQYSLWEKQLLGDKFKTEFQMEDLYTEILKPQKQSKKSFSGQSIQQHLQKEFQQEIRNFNRKNTLKNKGFLGIIVWMSISWLIWSGGEIFYLNYTGKVTHKIQKIHTQTALKVIPWISR